MRVNTDELERQAAALRYISARLCDIEDTVQQISHVLCRERFGEMFRSPLNIMARTIGNRTDEMNRMSAALQQISAIYERTERQIVDEAEHANVHHAHSLAGLIMIPSVPFWVNWTTEPTHPRYIPIVPDPGEDLQIVDGLPRWMTWTGPRPRWPLKPCGMPSTKCTAEATTRPWISLFLNPSISRRHLPLIPIRIRPV